MNINILFDMFNNIYKFEEKIMIVYLCVKRVNFFDFKFG